LFCKRCGAILLTNCHWGDRNRNQGDRQDAPLPAASRTAMLDFAHFGGDGGGHSAHGLEKADRAGRFAGRVHGWVIAADFLPVGNAAGVDNAIGFGGFDLAILQANTKPPS
jgi:hypothetical protein